MSYENSDHVYVNYGPCFIDTIFFFFFQYPMLNKATIDNDTPTPGYLFEDIISILFAMEFRLVLVFLQRHWRIQPLWTEPPSLPPHPHVERTRTRTFITFTGHIFPACKRHGTVSQLYLSPFTHASPKLVYLRWKWGIMSVKAMLSFCVLLKFSFVFTISKGNVLICIIYFSSVYFNSMTNRKEVISLAK